MGRALLAIAVTISVALPTAAAAKDEHVLSVPAAFPTVDAAIAAAVRGDVILLAAGTYPGGIRVPEDKAGITIRGIDRNTVVFDGGGIRINAIEVEADEVTLENLSAHDYVENGFYWEGVVGFAGRYLTVWNVGQYGIYAISSRSGVIEQSFVSGAADAAFYVGECHPCDTTVRAVTARLSAVGYSGTNAGGNLILQDSTFEANGVGILPNSYDVGLEPPPQREATFLHNMVRDSGTVPTPRQTPLGGFVGVGIGVAGGVADVVEANEVTGSARYGIVVVATVDRNTTWSVNGNQVRGNRVSGSGSADIALASGSGANNCFEANQATTLDPPELNTGCAPTGSGSQAVAAELQLPPPDLEQGLPPAPAYGSMPAPSHQPTMPAGGSTVGTDLVWLAVPVALLVAGAGALVLLVRQRRRGALSPSRD